MKAWSLSMIDPTAEIDPHALVDPGARLGAGTRVWAFAHVLAGAHVGAQCNIGEGAFIESGATLGNQVTVKNGVQIWEGVICQDGVFLGPHCVFTNHLRPRSFIKKPKDQWLKPTLIRKGATIGANATILCGHTIGEFAFVAAGALVTKDVPPHALVAGAPARVRMWICECTNNLKIVGKVARCQACGLRYTVLGKQKGLRRAASK